jgi:hypothetical protein
MAKPLLIGRAVLVLGILILSWPALAQAPDYQGGPPARLIRRPSRPELRPEVRPVERPRPPHPLDDRCRPLKEQLEAELQRSPAARRAFQARVASNAGSRFCREGHPERGIAEFERGLSYLRQGPRY